MRERVKRRHSSVPSAQAAASFPPGRVRLGFGKHAPSDLGCSCCTTRFAAAWIPIESMDHTTCRLSDSSNRRSQSGRWAGGTAPRVALALPSANENVLPVLGGSTFACAPAVCPSISLCQQILELAVLRLCRIVPFANSFLMIYI